MQTLIKKIADRHLYRVNSDLLEDYSTNPIPPNDTSYVGFFFEKDVTQFPPKLREKYEAMKAEIDLKEAEYREKYGDDWRNIAVFNAYRGIKEESEYLDESKERGDEIDDLSTEELRARLGDSKDEIAYSVYWKDVKNKLDPFAMDSQYICVKKRVDDWSVWVAQITKTKKVKRLDGISPGPDSFESLAAAKKFADSVANGRKVKESLTEDHFSEKELTNMYSKFDKENNHDGLEAIEDYISAEADGNKAAAAKAAGKLKKMMKEDIVSESAEYTPTFKKYGFKKGGIVSDGSIVFTHPLHGSVMVNKFGEWHHVPHGSSKDDGFEGTTAVSLENHLNRLKESVSEAIKGWKNAHSDIAKARSEQGKNVVLHRLKNDGTESGMATARTSFSSEEEALRRHNNMVQLNPGKKIGHNLYIDGKLIKALGEAVSESTVKMSMPLFIRLMEWAFEECKDDVQIHKLAENLSEISSVADMEDYPKLVKEELDEALQGNWSVEKIQKLKPAQIKTLTANAKAANDKAVLDMIQTVTAPKPKVPTIKMQPAKPKVDLDKVWYKIQDVVGSIVPDGDPIDYMAPWLEGQGIKGLDVGAILDKASKKHGYKDMYAYYDEVAKQYRDQVGEAYGDKKYGLGKKSDADKAAKAAAIERAKDKLANLRKAHAEAEDAGDDAKAESLEKQIKMAQADLGNIQAHG